MTKKVYDNAVNVLLDAYNNGTLEHGNCWACAVGNLVASASGYTFKAGDCGLVWKEGYGPDWSRSGMGMGFGLSLIESLKLKNTGETKRQIDSTGMSLEEIIIIEHAFEDSLKRTEKGYWYYLDFPDNQKQGQYIGLCAVIDVMKDMVEDEVPHVDNLERLEVIYEQFETVKS